jgi:hypothetical protein
LIIRSLICNRSREARRAAFLESGSVIQNRDLSPKFFQERDTPPRVASDDAGALSVRVDRFLSEIAQDVEIAALTYAMRATNGRMDLAARRLGLSCKGRGHGLALSGQASRTCRAASTTSAGRQILLSPLRRGPSSDLAISCGRLRRPSASSPCYVLGDRRELGAHPA